MTTTSPALLARSAALHLKVVPGHPAWTLVAQLSVEPPDVGAIETVIASGAVASRVSAVGVAETHELRLPPVAVRIPAGSVVRLRLRNLWLREPPMSPGLEAAPMFTDFEVAIVHDAVAGSWLDLPLEPVAPRLVANRQTIDLAAPQPIAATLRSRPGLPFFAVVGISGHQPGIPYLNDVVPVAADWLVQASAGSSEPPFFSGFLGWLDAAGEGQFTLDLSSAGPLPQLLSGWQLTFAAFVWDGPSAVTGAAANPLDVMLR